MLLLMLLLHLEENEEEHLFASYTKDIFIMFSPMIMRESKHSDNNSERFFRLKLTPSALTKNLSVLSRKNTTKS